MKLKLNTHSIEYEKLYAEPFSEKDFNAVQHLLDQLVTTKKIISPVDYASVLTESEVFVARLQNGKIVGMASLVRRLKLSGISAWIDDVVVDTGYRNLGIAKKLMQKVIWLATESGYKVVTLNTSRPKAVPFYLSLGFTLRDARIYKRTL
jgi:GNAT superfamily N-acetyltransferase